jgi:hypothetical protein
VMWCSHRTRLWPERSRGGRRQWGKAVQGRCGRSGGDSGEGAGGGGAWEATVGVGGGFERLRSRRGGAGEGARRWRDTGGWRSEL